jgi:hypothetical protein
MDIVASIRNGQLDINNQELFFSTLIKGLMLRLDDDISIRGIAIPHVIIHTGNENMYLEQKGYNNAIEPLQISNENYIYNIIPRCVIHPGGIDLLADQLTNPYTLGRLQYDSGEELHELVCEFRRVPVKLAVNLQYFTDTFRDLLELVQQIITKLSFIRTFNITYLGQMITCSYKIPDAFSGEHIMDMDGTTLDDKAKKLSLDLEVEACFPVYNPQTIMSADKFSTKILIGNKVIGVGASENNENEETVTVADERHGIKIFGTNEIK